LKESLRKAYCLARQEVKRTADTAGFGERYGRMKKSKPAEAFPLLDDVELSR